MMILNTCNLPIFDVGRLFFYSTFSCAEDFSVTAADGKNYRVKHYNIDAIIAVGWVDGLEVGMERGLERGAEKGVDAGAAKIVELIKSGLSPDEAMRKYNEERKTLITSLVHSPLQ